MPKFKYFIRLYQANYDMLTQQEKVQLAQMAAACDLFVFSTKQMTTTTAGGLYGLQTDFFGRKNPFDETQFLAFLNALFNSNIDLQKSNAEAIAAAEKIVQSFVADFCNKINLPPSTTPAQSIMARLIRRAKVYAFSPERLTGPTAALKSYIHGNLKNEKYFLCIYADLMDSLTETRWTLEYSPLYRVGDPHNSGCWILHPKTLPEKSSKQIFACHTLISSLLNGRLYAFDVVMADYDQFSNVSSMCYLPADLKKTAKYMGILPPQITTGKGNQIMLRIEDRPSEWDLQDIFKDKFGADSSEQISIEIND